MKFSTTLFVSLPLLACQVLAVAVPAPCVSAVSSPTNKAVVDHAVRPPNKAGSVSSVTAAATTTGAANNPAAGGIRNKGNAAKNNGGNAANGAANAGNAATTTTNAATGQASAANPATGGIRNKGNAAKNNGGNAANGAANAGNAATTTTNAATSTTSAANKATGGNKNKGNVANAANNTASGGNAANNTANGGNAANNTANGNAANNTAAGNGGSNLANGGNAQTSLTLDPAVVAKGFANNGQDVPVAGQVASLTSTNNFINFCLTVNAPITNGQQIRGGSCNPAPIGVIPSTNNMPSSKFVVPTNMQNFAENTAFTIQMAVSKLTTGNFVNANANYFAAPQQLDGNGQIKGHSHVVIEQISDLRQTTPTNPNVFAFFKGLNAAASGGVLTADVTAGLPAGTYRLASINTSSNHAPVIVPVAQHGSLDDVVYFTVGDAAKAAAAKVAQS